MNLSIRPFLNVWEKTCCNFYAFFKGFQDTLQRVDFTYHPLWKRFIDNTEEPILLYEMTLSDTLARKDVNGIGFTYKVKTVPTNPRLLAVCYCDKAGNLTEIRYKKRIVEHLVKQNEWVPVREASEQIICEHDTKPKGRN